MEVHGRDAARDAYVVSVRRAGRRVRAYVPDTVISEQMHLTGGLGHAHAWDWLARRTDAIERAIDARLAGARPRAPFDRMDLAEDD